MLKLLRWFVIAALLVLVTAVLVWLVSRWMPLPRVQQQALELMEQPARLPGANAFEMVWLLDFDDVPDAARPALIAEDGRRIAEAARTPADDAGGEDDWEPAITRAAQGRYPEVPDMAVVCSWRGADCLPQVRAAPLALAQALQSQQGLLTRIAALSRYDRYQSPFVADAHAPLPRWGLLQRSSAAHALAHVQGHSDAALAGICNDARTGRMLMSHSDGLVPTVLGAGMVQGNVRLLAEVLAELPLDHALPEACKDVFTAAAPAELSMCTAMRGEFQMVSSGGPDPRQPMAMLVWDARKYRAAMAQRLQGACLPASTQALAADQAQRWPVPPPQSLWRLECAANAMGCILADIASPAYDGYATRLQDAGASLRAAEALLWLRAHPQGSTAESLAAMPLRLRGQRRPLQLDADGQQLRVALYGKPGSDDWLGLPLPASRLPD